MEQQNWKKIEALFNATQEIPLVQRKKFLLENCGNDASLLAAVESLLAHQDQTEVANDVIGKAAYSLINQSAADLSGEHIGPYQIIQKLGEGGMGCVYLAERVDQHYAKKVAIKVIRQSVASQNVMQRFKIERQILANLEHPYIARLLDGGTSEQGLPYLVMEYVEGEPLDEYCNKRQLGVRARLKLFRKVCSAVHYAHQQLVVHRDLKPSNLMITLEGEPRLLDFGIAKLLDESPSEQTRMATAIEERLLTPLYSSPEQIKGEAVSTVTDVYALGVVLYELLTARRPYGGSEESRYLMEKTILEKNPTLPSQVVLDNAQSVLSTATTHHKLAEEVFDINAKLDWCGGLTSAQLKRQLRGDLDNMLLMALRKEPKFRYHSVAQLDEDINHFLNDHPVLARPTSWSYRCGKLLRRNKVSTIMGGLLFLSVLSGTLAIINQSQQVVRERDFAQQQSARASAINGLMSSIFSGASPDKAQGNELSVREMLDTAIEKLDNNKIEKSAQQYEVEAAVRRQIGRLYHDLGKVEDAHIQLEKALQQHRQHQFGETEELVLTLLDLSEVYQDLTQYEQMFASLSEALEISQRVLGKEHRLALESMEVLANYYNMSGQQKKAAALHLELYQLRHRIFGELHYKTISSMHSLAVVYQWMGKYQQAEEYSRQCQQKAEAVLGITQTLTLTCQSVLGSVLETSGEYASAEPIITSHIERAARILGAEHPETLRSMHNLADTYRGLGRFSESEKLFLQTLAVRRKVLGDNNIEVLQSQMKLARLYRQQSKYSLAMPLVADTVTKHTETLGFEHPTTLIAAQELADLYLARSDLETAQDWYARVLVARDKVLNPYHPELLKTLIGLVSSLLAQEQIEQAEQYLERALLIVNKNPEADRKTLLKVASKFIGKLESLNKMTRARYFRQKFAQLTEL